ncbi:MULTISPECIES: CpaD family pilus assembly protein [unclassified Roseitalea]|uniref:CpaD family pilus assembly protein n=1 Tax=unclassified Roseitalea TaxID=2639107 RepID=UPI00273E4334|nr:MULTISPECIES: CpaD family pilus assembly protein [unclassified Roseitalea]
MSATIFRTVTGLFVGATLLAGCGTTAKDPMTVGSVGDHRVNHPIVVTERQQTLDVPVASGARELTAAVKSNISAFAASFADSGTGVIHVLVPVGSANEHAVDRVRGDIVAAIEQGGASRHDVAIQGYDASGHGPSAAVRLSFVGMTASTPRPCGQRPADLADTRGNRPYADFGCSTQSNLAAMVENPGDLLGPRETSPIDGAQRSVVLGGYQGGFRGGTTGEVNY